MKSEPRMDYERILLLLYVAEKGWPKKRSQMETIATITGLTQERLRSAMNISDARGFLKVTRKVNHAN